MTTVGNDERFASVRLRSATTRFAAFGRNCAFINDRRRENPVFVRSGELCANIRRRKLSVRALPISALLFPSSPLPHPPSVSRRSTAFIFH